MTHTKSRRIPSKQWRDCIKKIYEADSQCCPKCGGEMKIVSFITDQNIIRQILKHLGLWTPVLSRDLPNTTSSPKNHELVYELFDDRLHSIYRQMIGPATMNPVLQKIKPLHALFYRT